MSSAHLKITGLSKSLARPAAAGDGFDPFQALASSGYPIQTLSLRPKEVIYSQGSPANSVFYLQSGRVRLTAVSSDGKEATIALLGDRDFLGEHSMSRDDHMWMATAVALTDCVLMKISRNEMSQIMQRDPRFLNFFMTYLLGRSMRMYEALLDLIFYPSEKRLARILLLLAGPDESWPELITVPKISHEDLATMVGTTRARISFFMNRFRKHGFIDYDSAHRGTLTIKRSLTRMLTEEYKCAQCEHNGDESCHGQCAFPAAGLRLIDRQ